MAAADSGSEYLAHAHRCVPASINKCQALKAASGIRQYRAGRSEYSPDDGYSANSCKSCRTCRSFSLHPVNLRQADPDIYHLIDRDGWRGQWDYRVAICVFRLAPPSGNQQLEKCFIFNSRTPKTIGLFLWICAFSLYYNSHKYNKNLYSLLLFVFNYIVIYFNPLTAGPYYIRFYTFYWHITY